jgi:hypothetical protein
LKEKLNATEKLMELQTLTVQTLQHGNDNLRDTIKGLDRSTVTYTEAIASKDKAIEVLNVKLLDYVTRYANHCVYVEDNLVTSCETCHMHLTCREYKLKIELQKEVEG